MIVAFCFELLTIIDIESDQFVERLVGWHQGLSRHQLHVNPEAHRLHLHVHVDQVSVDAHRLRLPVPVRQILPQQRRIRTLRLEHGHLLLQDLRGRGTVVVIVQRSGEEQNDEKQTRHDRIGDPRLGGQSLGLIELLVEQWAAHELPGGFVSSRLQEE